MPRNAFTMLQSITKNVLVMHYDIVKAVRHLPCFYENRMNKNFVV